MPFRLRVPESVRDAMIAQALAEQPNECCGFLAGCAGNAGRTGVPVGRVVTRFPLSTCWRVRRATPPNPRGLFEANRRCATRLGGAGDLPLTRRARGPESHRFEGQRYEDAVVHLIISLMTSPPTIRGWRLTAAEYREKEWVVIATEPRRRERRTVRRSLTSQSDENGRWAIVNESRAIREGSRRPWARALGGRRARRRPARSTRRPTGPPGSRRVSSSGRRSR